LGPSLKDSASRKQIRRYRIKHQIPVVEARNVQDVDIPMASRMYLNGNGQEELFVLGDSGKDDAERLVNFYLLSVTIIQLYY